MRATFFTTVLVTLASAVLAAPTNSASMEKRGNGGRVTYYSGYMMANPACGGVAPNDDDMVAAVRSDSQFKCGDDVTLWNGDKSVTVKIVDHCESCTFGEWFDISKSAFSKLGALELGIINDIAYWNWSKH
ncbi:hypothetical protein MVES_001344 [Malassezia vespertilionis]|uniref:RlpA-like protein double-psi beta-barrel domain-containing protein n=1 Tax=Malassezia vespertilionis TaxID=2020962 RepID=A0A2N1JEQ9_9BASI|nr:hypothetical protein MVES_001344 [Malassezia vespertilionis]